MEACVCVQTNKYQIHCMGRFSGSMPYPYHSESYRMFSQDSKQYVDGRRGTFEVKKRTECATCSRQKCFTFSSDANCMNRLTLWLSTNCSQSLKERIKWNQQNNVGEWRTEDGEANINETIEKLFLHSLKLRLNAIDGCIWPLTNRGCVMCLCVLEYLENFRSVRSRFFSVLFANTSFWSFAFAH